MIREAQNLSIAERTQFIKALVNLMTEPPETSQQRRLSELRGSGKEIWQGIADQEYIDQQRDKHWKPSDR